MDLRLEAAWQPAQSAPLLQLRSDYNPLQDEGDAIRWGKLRKIAGAVYGSAAPHGRPLVLRCSANWVVLGTETADILVFDYEQELKVKLTPPPLENGRYGAVTSLAISQDESCIAAGFATGSVLVWDINYPTSPKMSILPTITRKAAGAAEANESHLYGSIVCFVFFVGKHKSTVISMDNRGLIFIHQNMRILLGTTARSRRVNGQYKQKTPTPILAATVIKQENAPLLIVTTNPFTLRGFSIVPLKSQFRFSSTLDNVDTNTGLAASLAYCSATKKLAYSWGNILKVVSIKWNGEEYVVTADRMIKGTESFVYIGWLTDSLLAAVTVTQELQFYGADLTMLSKASILRKYPLHQDYYSEVLKEGKLSVVADAFYNAIQVQDANVFILGRHEFEYGTLANWADCIMSLLNQSRPVNAVLLLLQYYTSDYDLSMIGLEKETRKDVLEKALPDIILTSMRFCVTHDVANFPKLLAVSIQAVVVTQVPLLEEIMDMVLESSFSQVYFDFLVTFVLDGSIKRLPPKVFKELVKAKADSKVIQDIILSLDISTLDFDLALNICEEFQLEEAKVFLLNALNDFITPLDGPDRFAYLSYVLTGRAYPTEKPLKNPIRAKSEVYERLFASDHACLESLVDADAASFFRALNEAFEDSDLNDDEEAHLPVSRQMMLNVLFDTIRNPYFDVFVARNYPKYQQYLMVPVSRLDKVLANILDSELPQNDRELAIESLLSVYKPTNMDKFLGMLHEEKLFSVLENIYRAQGNYKKMLLASLEDPSDNKWQLIPVALDNDKSVYPVLVEHLKGLMDSPEKLADIAVRYCNEMHREVLKLNVSVDAQYQYLDRVFALVKDSALLPSPEVCNKYVELLAEKDSEKLMKVLRHTLTRPENINLPLIVDSLLENRQTGALALLLCRLDRKPEAMIYLKNHIRTRQPDEDIEEYVGQAIDICRDVSSVDASEGEALWISLLEAEMGTSYEIAQTIRVLVEGNQNVAIEVISKLLPDIEVKSAAALIDEAYTAMAIQLIALQAVQAVVEGDLYRSFIESLNDRLRGWSISANAECEGCGEKVSGLGVDANVLYRAWENKMKNSEIPGTMLAIFQCRHAYHMDCLKRLSSERECILCFPDTH